MKREKLLPLEEKVLKTIRRHGMLAPGDRVIVALSGGADSVALLVCLQRLGRRLGITLTAAHLNHGLRARESDADERFVRRLCATLAVELVVEKAVVREKAKAAKQNLEEAAREARYVFLRRTAGNTGAARIAVGHNLDDQAETALLRFFRGSGAAGLSSIHPVVDGIIVRPLIETGREEILRYLDSLSIGHREDSSNRDLRLRRNLLRHKWIPQLKRDFNPRLVETLARHADLARETADFLEHAASEAYQRLRTPIPAGTSLPIKELRELHPLLRKLIFRRAVREVRGTLRGITARHIDSLTGLCREGKSGLSAELPGGSVAIRRFGNIAILEKRPGKGAHFEYELKVPGRCKVPEAGVEIVAILKDGGTPPASSPDSGSGRGSSRDTGGAYPFFAVLDGEGLPGTLTVRSRRMGDRYGGAGRRKVKKMLIDARIDLEVRSRIPVVATDEDVLWIPGFSPARRFAACLGSRSIVVLEVRRL